MLHQENKLEKKHLERSRVVPTEVPSGQQALGNRPAALRCLSRPSRDAKRTAVPQTPEQ